MISTETRRRLSIGLNALLVLGSARNLWLTDTLRNPANMKYYTELSNLLAGVMALVLIGYTVRALRDPGASVPRAVQLLKWMTVCCLAVTFLVVALVLGPESGSVRGYVAMFVGGSVTYSHLLNPLLAVGAWITVDAHARVSRDDILWALVPTVLYALVMALLNLTGRVVGPYFFLEVTRQPALVSLVWTVVVLGLNAGVAWGLVVLSERFGWNRQRGV